MRRAHAGGGRRLRSDERDEHIRAVEHCRGGAVGGAPVVGALDVRVEPEARAHLGAHRPTAVQPQEAPDPQWLAGSGLEPRGGTVAPTAAAVAAGPSLAERHVRRIGVCPRGQPQVDRAALGAKAAGARGGRGVGVGGVGGVGHKGRERERELQSAAALTLELAGEVQRDAAPPPMQRARHELAHPQRGRRLRHGRRRRRGR